MTQTSEQEISTQLYQFGREAMSRKEFERAADLLRCSVQLTPHFKTLELLGECLLASGKPSSEAIVFLAAAAGLGNRASRSFFLLAKALLLQGRIEEAIEKLDTAIDMQPQFKTAIELRDQLKRVGEGEQTAADDQ